MLLGFILLLAALLTPQQQQEIDQLNAEIKSSTQEKQRHEALALKYQDQANRFQNSHKIQDARRFYDMEEHEKEIVKYLEREIDNLEKEKQEILGEKT